MVISVSRQYDFGPFVNLRSKKKKTMNITHFLSQLLMNRDKAS